MSFVARITVCACWGVVLAAGLACAAEPMATTVSDELDFAEGLFARNLYEMAFTEYERIAQTHPTEPQGIQARFKAAESLFFAGRYDEAITRYQAHADAYPQSPEAEKCRRRIGESFYHQGKKGEALGVFKALFTNTSQETQDISRYYAGKIAFEGQDSRLAYIHFSRVAGVEGAQSLAPYAAYYLGEIELQRLQYDSALARFDSVLNRRIAELEQSAYLGKGRAYFYKEDYAAASEEFRKAMTGADESLKGEAFLSLLRALYNAGQYDQVVAVYAAPPAAPKAVLRPGAFIAALAYVKIKDYRKANETYDAVLADPESSAQEKTDAEMGKIEILVEVGDSQTAFEMLKARGDAESAQSDRIRYLQIESLRKTSKTDEALALIDGFLKEFTQSEWKDEVMASRAYLLIEKGDLANARLALIAFVDTFNPHPLREKTLSDSVLVDIKMASWKDAVADALRFLKEFPQSKDAGVMRLRLASFYSQEKRYDEAIKVYEEYLQTASDAAKIEEARFQIGVNHERAGRNAEAVKVLSQVQEASIGPELVYQVHKHRAYCHVLLGQFDEAAELYDKMISRFPQNDLNPEVYFWLAEHFRKKSNAAGIRDLMGRFKLRPEAAEHAAAVAFFSGEADRLEAHCAEALAHYAAVIEGAKAFAAEARMGRGLCQEQAKDWVSAQASFAEAVKDAGDNYALAADARMASARIYEAEGKPAEAARAYLTIGILYDDAERVPPSLLRAAELFIQIGQNDEAARVLREIMERFGRRPEARQARVKLKAMGKL